MSGFCHRIVHSPAPEKTGQQHRAGGIHSVIQGNSGGRIEFGPVHKARPSAGVPLHNFSEVIWCRHVVMKWSCNLTQFSFGDFNIQLNLSQILL